MIDISIIIPFKNSLDTLPRLLNSIPDQDNIEIILVENSDNPLSRDELCISREYKLLNAKSNRYAGGARNVGIDAASGKWIIFADADDFFTPNAFDIYNSYIDSNYELIYFGCDSVYTDTLKKADRHIMFNDIVQKLHKRSIPEIQGKLYHVVPWAKMIRLDFINKYNIRFDEVIASNDIYFSTLCGYYSERFWYDIGCVYTVTIRKGSLANKWNKEIVKARFLVALRRNKFLKSKDLGQYQVSVMYYFFQAFKIQPSLLPIFFIGALKMRQNIFIGIGSWIKTLRKENNKYKINKNYIEFNSKNKL